MNHDQTTKELRKRIGQTTASLNQCAAQDKAIATGATARFKQVQDRLDVVRKTAITDPKAADEYLDLTKEKGALLRTLEPARRAWVVAPNLCCRNRLRPAGNVATCGRIFRYRYSHSTNHGTHGKCRAAA